jgi:hypothetical protein
MEILNYKRYTDFIEETFPIDTWSAWVDYSKHLSQKNIVDMLLEDFSFIKKVEIDNLLFPAKFIDILYNIKDEYFKFKDSQDFYFAELQKLKYKDEDFDYITMQNFLDRERK